MIRRLTVGDVLIGLAALALLVALAAPALRARSFRSLVDAAGVDVDALERAASGLRQRSGAWPGSTEPGEVPAELSRTGPAAFSMVGEEYVLQWSVLEVVEHVEAPPPAETLPPDPDPPPDSVGPELIPVVRQVGGVTLYSADAELLAELLARYGSDVSFVHDSTWTLVVQPGSPP